MTALRSFVPTPACMPFIIRRKTCGKTILRIARQLCIAGLYVITIHATAADPDVKQAPAAHPLTGKWTWTLPGKACTEIVHFRADGKRAGTSGEEVTEADFQITLKPSLFGFYRLNETLTVANGKRDCAGDLHVAGDESTTRFIQLSPKNDQLIVCKTESLQACYGPLRRAAE
jgi:hypothetical protein